MTSKGRILGRRLTNLARRVLNRARFFPFSLLFVAVNAAGGALQLRRGWRHVAVGETTGETTALLPRNVMLWLDRLLAGSQGHQFDVCLRLPREAADANLHDVLSVMLAFGRARSVGLYWDSSSLADDLPLWGGRQEGSGSAVGAAPCEDLSSPCRHGLEEFIQDKHAEIALPVLATRDAQTFVKRQAGGACVVCLNVPPESGSPAETLARARPDVWFFDLSPRSLHEERAANNQSIFDHGFTMHERMALVQAADAYVGSFDEMGCTALISGRPAVLLGGGSSNWTNRTSRGEVAVWLPGPIEPAALVTEVLQFLSRLGGESTRSSVG